MPWTKNTYPPSMKNLPSAVRGKAIDIANALLDESNMNEGRVIATAISRAKDWAANRGKRTGSTNPRSKVTDLKKHGEDRYVIPHGDAWALKKEGAKRVEKTFDNKTEAISLGREKAKRANASLTIQSKNGKVQRRISYNPNRGSATR